MSSQKQRVIDDLRAGNTSKYKASGNSMSPRIMSGSTVTLEPIELLAVKVRDEVFCKVRGNIYVHLVTALEGGDSNRRVQISNNHGHVNGWTRTVYGIVTHVERP